jgi:hypothetical protein
MKDLQMLIKDIAAAIEMNGFKSYLNKETQDVQMLPDELHIPYTDMDMFQELLDKLEANPEQYIEIESLSSREGFILMEDFAANLKDKNTQNRLYNALSRPKPFRQFRYALEENDLLQQWYAFKDAYYEQLAKEWLTKHFIHLHS